MRVTPKKYALDRNRHLSAVQRAVEAGKILKGEDGLIDEDQADRDWLSTATTKPKKQGKSPSAEAAMDFHQAKLMKETAQAKLAQLDYDSKSGELASIAEMNRWFSACILKAREELLVIAGELQDALAEESRPSECGRMIDHRIRRALENLREFATKEALKAA